MLTESTLKEMLKRKVAELREQQSELEKDIDALKRTERLFAEWLEEEVMEQPEPVDTAVQDESQAVIDVPVIERKSIDPNSVKPALAMAAETPRKKMTQARRSIREAIVDVLRKEQPRSAKDIMIALDEQGISTKSVGYYLSSSPLFVQAGHGQWALETFAEAAD